VLPPDDDVKSIRLDHVAIDRITGFASDARKFDALALASPEFRVRLFVRWTAGDWDATSCRALAHRIRHERAAVMLLLMTLRDMQEQLLWVGSRTTRGYGWLSDLEVEKIEGSHVRKVKNKWSRVPVRPSAQHAEDDKGYQIATLERVQELTPMLDELTAAWTEELAAAKHVEVAS
jgi:hypothetical protein